MIILTGFLVVLVFVLSIATVAYLSVTAALFFVSKNYVIGTVLFLTAIALLTALVSVFPHYTA